MNRLPTIPMPISAIIAIAATLSCTLPAANAQDSGRSGKQVVEEVCARCHETGVDEAPRIGDNEAWSARASAGLSALTQHALDGIRQMPAHGGQPDLTDMEIARAITYMVNASGGEWVEPAGDSQLMTERTGQQVVEAVCNNCHQEGKEGAPRVGDTQAWVARLQHGLPYAVRSAIRGHGGMPPRGGAVDLTDAEIRHAIIYMLNPQAAVARGTDRPVRKRNAPIGTNHVTIAGLDVYLGVISAEQLREYESGSTERTMHGGVPDGDGWYHVNISLLDAERHVPITEAQVDARVEGVGVSPVSKPLEPMALGAGSYGAYFRMKSRKTYRIIAHAQVPGSPESVEVQFRFKRN